MKPRVLISTLVACLLIPNNIQAQAHPHETRKRLPDGSPEAMMTEVIVRPLSLAGTVLGGAIHIITWPFAALGGQDTTESKRQLIDKPLEATFKRPLGDFTRLKEINRGKHQPVDRTAKTVPLTVILGRPSAPTPAPTHNEPPTHPEVNHGVKESAQNKTDEGKTPESKKEESKETTPQKPTPQEVKPDEQKKPSEIKPSEETTEPKKEIPAPVEPPTNPENPDKEKPDAKNENPETPAPVTPSTNPENPDKETEPEAKDPLKDGLVAYFPFNGNANDVSGQGHETKVISAKLTTDRHSQDKKAYLFDGKQDYIDIKSAIVSDNFYDKPASHAISVWVTIDGSAPDGDLVILSDEYGSSCDHKYRIMIKKTGGMLQPSYDYYSTGRVGEGDSSSRGRIGLLGKSRPFVNGQWHHLMTVYDLKKKIMCFYVDGKEEKTLPILLENGLPIWTRLPNPSSIGALRGCTSFTPAPGLRNYFKGKIDDLRFYNRALSADEVKALHDMEKPKAEKKEDSEKPAEPKEEPSAPLEPPTNPETPDGGKKPTEVNPSEETPEPKKETPGPVEPKIYQSPSGKAYPAHWGAPPLRQTRDLQPLPGGYGNGSGTLARWIQENLNLDALPKTENPEKEKKPAENTPNEGETPEPKKESPAPVDPPTKPETPEKETKPIQE